MTPRARIAILIVAGVVVVAGHAAFLAFQPFNRQVPQFLVLYAALCAGIAACRAASRNWDSGDDRFFRVEAAVVLAGAFLTRALLHVTDPTLSDDVFRYVWDGRVQLAGINPFLYAPAAPELEYLRDGYHALINHPTVHTIYPPLSQFVFRLAAAVRPTVELQKLAFITFDLVTVGFLLAMLRARKRPAAWAALYAWHPLPAVEFAGSGHNDSLMLCLMLAGCWLYERRRETASYAAFGLASLAKLIPVVMFPWVIVRGRFKGTLAYAAAIAVVTAPFAYGIWTAVSSIEPATSGARTFARDWVFNPSLYGWLSGFIQDPTDRKIVLGSVLVAFSFWWARRNADPARYAFGALLALLLASPVVHPWYVLWLLPFGALLGHGIALLWAWTVAFTYVVQIRYATEGVWLLPDWVPAAEYALVYLALAVSAIRMIRRPAAPRRVLPPIDRPGVAVIIPALNEEKSIGLVIGEIPRLNIREIIVVDNGSSDGTAAAATAAGARVVREPQRGYGRAILRGLSSLSPDANVVVILDGDRSDFPEELPKLLKPIEDGNADLVIGNRTKAALPGSLLPHQRFGNWLTCVLIRLMYGHRFGDMGPFRAIRRDALEEMGLRDENFGWNVEMQVKALQKGFRAVDIPVRYRPRIGTSKISGSIKGSFKAGVIILWSIYRYGFSGSTSAPDGIRRSAQPPSRSPAYRERPR